MRERGESEGMPGSAGPSDETELVLDELSEKQRRAARAALTGGFFERPQGATAEEIAADLDITRSTFLYHLRNAEQILFERVFADEP